MSGRAPLWVLSVPILSVLAICLYLHQRRGSQPPPDPPDDGESRRSSPSAAASGQPDSADRRTAAAASDQPDSADRRTAAAASDQPDSADCRTAAAASDQPDSADCRTAAQPDSADRPTAAPAAGSTTTAEKLTSASKAEKPVEALDPGQPESDPVVLVKQDIAPATGSCDQSECSEVAVNAEVVCRTEAAATMSAPAAAPGGGGEQADLGVDEAIIATQIIPAASAAAPADEATGAGGDSILAELQAAMGAGGVRPAESEQPQSATWADQAEAHDTATNSAQPPEADATSENSSDSGKGGSSVSLEQTSPSSTEPPLPAIYDFLIPQKLCGRLIGKNGTFVNMLKSRTGANVFIRVHPVKTAVKICTVEGTQSEIDACLELIREKFPVQKFPAITLERLSRPQEPPSVPVSQQLHLPQSATCDVLVSAIVSPGQLFLQQHTHPTFRGLERLNMLMTACYAGADVTPQLPRPVPPSSVCAAPVLDGWYRAQVVAYYPDTDQVDVRYLDYGGYNRQAAADVRQIRTDFMSLPFQAEECYLANVLPNNEEGWTAEESAVFESLISEGALEAMVVGHADDGVPFVNLYCIQRTPTGLPTVALVNQQLVEAGGARWVENQA